MKSVEKEVKSLQPVIKRIKQEASKTVVGQVHIIDALIRSFIANGHVLLEGIPGIAKTLIIKTLAKITGSMYARIQFTPDLLPTDIIGLTTYHERKGFTVLKGPIFANFILADEINRSPAKVQSALLEAMQEKQVTIGKKTYALPLPFFVLATQNPIESSGTYELPEAQIDRFLFKVQINYPKIDEERLILSKNITVHEFDSYKLKQATTPDKILQMQRIVKDIYLDPKVEHYIVRLVDATRDPTNYKITTGRYIQWGSSPRGSIGLFIASKAEALIRGEAFVTPEHVRAVAYDVLRHRIMLSYEGQAENVKTEQIVSEILAKVPIQ